MSAHDNIDDIQALPLASLDVACCGGITDYHDSQNNPTRHTQKQSNPTPCIEMIRRTVRHKQQTTWVKLLNGCLGGILLGRLVSHPAWPRAREYHTAQAYLVFAFTRFDGWRGRRAERGQPIRVGSMGALVVLLHKCLHAAVIDELRLWAPPGTWRKRRHSATQPSDDPAQGASPTDIQHWQTRRANEEDPPREPHTDETPEKQAIRRERLRELVACANDDREKRLIGLRWYMGYAPREIAERWKSEYPDSEQISEVLQNLLARYYRKVRKHERYDAS